jgi:spore coat polysaccharide biosynthesis protein SpsF (cytidylyltransferase family)
MKMQTILVVVRGGAAYVIEDTVPKGTAVEIIDFDNLQDADDLKDPTTPEFSKTARDYIARTDKDVAARLASGPMKSTIRREIRDNEF